MKSINSIIILVVLVFSSCKNHETVKPSTLDGLWKSIGYGRIVKIETNEFSIADLTRISCIPLFDGHVSDFGDKLKLVNDTLTLKDGINMYYFTRLLEDPEVCLEDLSDEKMKDPVYNFEVLSETFKNEYAYFKVRGVNWDDLYNRYRVKINSNMTDAELYRTMEDMLDEFDDGHIGLDAPNQVEKAAKALIVMKETQVNTTQSKLYRKHEVVTMIAKKYLKNVKHLADKTIQWGIINDSIGYLQINEMDGFADYNLQDSLSGQDFWEAYSEKANQSNNYNQDQLNGVNNIMTSVLEDFKNTKCTIIDLRFNGGGSYEVALEFMKYFNNKERFVFTKQARFGSTYTKPTSVNLKKADIVYSNPVYLLTSHESASATEIMVLSSLTLDNVNRIGSHTEGVFSDVLDKALPNGWEFGLSNEVYLDANGVNYESIGIPPNIKLDYVKKLPTIFKKYS